MNEWGIQPTTGWCFGTCFIFPYIGKFIIPTDELIFFRGVETTNQYRYVKLPEGKSH
jgi:hypothetical protein